MARRPSQAGQVQTLRAKNTTGDPRDTNYQCTLNEGKRVEILAGNTGPPKSRAVGYSVGIFSRCFIPWLRPTVPSGCTTTPVDS